MLVIPPWTPEFFMTLLRRRIYRYNEEILYILLERDSPLTLFAAMSFDV